MLIVFFSFSRCHLSTFCTIKHNSWQCVLLQSTKGVENAHFPETVGLESFVDTPSRQARPHTSSLTREFMSKNGVETIPHPPYSPDLAPCDFWMFPTLKKELRGRRFVSKTEIQNAIQNFFNSIPEEEFRKTMLDKWQERMKKCIRFDGRYFEKQKEVMEDSEESGYEY